MEIIFVQKRYSGYVLRFTWKEASLGIRISFLYVDYVTKSDFAICVCFPEKFRATDIYLLFSLLPKLVSRQKPNEKSNC